MDNEKMVCGPCATTSCQKPIHGDCMCCEEHCNCAPPPSAEVMAKCPFCGGQARVETPSHIYDVRAWGQCASCGTRGPDMPNIPQARDAWNNISKPARGVSGDESPRRLERVYIYYLIEWLRSEGDWAEVAKCPDVDFAKTLLKSYTSSFLKKCRIIRETTTKVREVVK